MLDHYFSCLPDTDRVLREAAFAEFSAQGFPGKLLESWHYTDFSSLADVAFMPGKPGESPAYPFDAATPLPSTGVPPATFTTAFALDGLSKAFAVSGVSTALEGQTDAPLLISQPDPGAGQMCHWRHQITMRKKAVATVILWDAPGTEATSASFATTTLQLTLCDNSQLRLIRVQQAPAQATRALHVCASVNRGASLQVFTLDLSQAKSRFELHASLDGAGASAEVLGLTAARGRAHADTQIQISHAAPQCTSRMEFRLLAAEKSKVIFNGKVVVQAGAIKTDSQTRCHSLLLAATAEIDAKPELEINADDVKCAHGSTFGQLDDEAEFYLRTRGISAAEARSLLTQAFSLSVLEKIPHPLLRAFAEAQVQDLLREAQA